MNYESLLWFWCGTFFYVQRLSLATFWGLIVPGCRCFLEVQGYHVELFYLDTPLINIKKTSLHVLILSKITIKLICQFLTRCLGIYLDDALVVLLLRLSLNLNLGSWSMTLLSRVHRLFKIIYRFTHTLFFY